MNTQKLTIGLDLGDRRHHACVLDAAGGILAEEVIANTREVLTAFCARYPGATVVMETGTHSPWVSRVVAALKHPVIVANARKLRAISQSQTKSDREDAQMLARLGRADPKLLSPVRHRSEATQRALVRLKVREALVRSRVNLINSARFLLKSLGVFVSSSIKAMAFTRKVRAQLAPADVALVEPLLAVERADGVWLWERADGVWLWNEPTGSGFGTSRRGTSRRGLALGFGTSRRGLALGFGVVGSLLILAPSNRPVRAASFSARRNRPCSERVSASGNESSFRPRVPSLLHSLALRSRAALHFAALLAKAEADPRLSSTAPARPGAPPRLLRTMPHCSITA